MSSLVAERRVLRIIALLLDRLVAIAFIAVVNRIIRRFKRRVVVTVSMATWTPHVQRTFALTSAKTLKFTVTVVIDKKLSYR